MVFIFKTYPFNMSFEEIKKMTFVQAVAMIKELNNQTAKRQKQVKKILKANKDVMGVFEVTRGIYE